MAKVLIVDDDPSFRQMLKTFLQKKGYSILEASNGRECLACLETNEIHLILLDFRLPDKEGITLLQEIKNLNSIPVIIITKYAHIKNAVQAIKMGAFEYVTKPVNTDEILYTVSSALKSTKTPHPEKHFIEGKDVVARKLNEYVELVGPTDMSVIIQGETGTGKEYVARRIHEKSKRANKPFVAVDCGALTEELAGSELFGHVKGAFTGAVTEKSGQFQTAHGGTLFLDEIGNLSYDIQVKLLRALQERKIRKIGGNKDIDVDVRLLAATNEDLIVAVKEGRFREDLYHRINEFLIKVPPLRKRNADIPLFAAHFLSLANKELNKNVEAIPPELIEIFRSYFWPGNLREMKNVIKKAVLLAKSEYLNLDCLPEEMTLSEMPHPVNNNHEPHEEGYNLKTKYLESERTTILHALEKTKYNKTKAAKLLNIDRKTLYHKLKYYDLLN